jgi:hypothetical protein
MSCHKQFFVTPGARLSLAGIDPAHTGGHRYRATERGLGSAGLLSNKVLANVRAPGDKQANGTGDRHWK